MMTQWGVEKADRDGLEIYANVPRPKAREWYRDFGFEEVPEHNFDLDLRPYGSDVTYYARPMVRKPKRDT